MQHLIMHQRQGCTTMTMEEKLKQTPSVAERIARLTPGSYALTIRPARSDVLPPLIPVHTLPPPTGSPLLAYDTYEAARISGICRSILYREIRAGRLIARKSGRSTLILDDDLRAFLASLPQMPATKPAGEAAAAAVVEKTADAGRVDVAS
jgi:hypothetical protein